MHIFLFHRDLRLHDNTSLIYQIKKYNNITPIFIFTPEQINPKKNKYFSNNSVQFMIESLIELRQDIQNNGGELYFFKGDNIDVLKSIHKIIPIQSIAFNMDYTPYARQRDKMILDWSNDNNIDCIIKEDYVLYDILDNKAIKNDNTPYLVFTPFKNHCYNNLTVREPDNFKKFIFKKHKELSDNKYIISKSDIEDFYTDNPDINVHGGRTNGLKILSKLDNFNNYQKERDTLMFETTYLGAHNHFSTISIREEYYKMINKLGKKSGLINELHWREFYLHITYHFPHILDSMIGKGKNKEFKSKYSKIKWSKNMKLFEKWCSGQTGCCIVDAAMNQLNKIGFQHNRCRMITSNYLVKLLHIHWTLGEMYFATKLVDYDPCVNNNSWQWSFGSGVDAQPYFRIFNPYLQAEKFDKDCEYIKKWIPELANVPAKDIHNWYKPEVHNKYLNEGIKYYKPIIDYNIERDKCLEIFKKGLL